MKTFYCCEVARRFYQTSGLMLAGPLVIFFAGRHTLATVPCSFSRSISPFGFSSVSQEVYRQWVIVAVRFLSRMHPKSSVLPFENYVARSRKARQKKASDSFFKSGDCRLLHQIVCDAYCVMAQNRSVSKFQKSRR